MDTYYDYYKYINKKILYYFVIELVKDYSMPNAIYETKNTLSI